MRATLERRGVNQLTARSLSLRRSERPNRLLRAADDPRPRRATAGFARQHLDDPRRKFPLEIRDELVPDAIARDRDVGVGRVLAIRLAASPRGTARRSSRATSISGRIDAARRAAGSPRARACRRRGSAAAGTSPPDRRACGRPRPRRRRGGRAARRRTRSAHVAPHLRSSAFRRARARDVAAVRRRIGRPSDAASVAAERLVGVRVRAAKPMVEMRQRRRAQLAVPLEFEQDVQRAPPSPRRRTRPRRHASSAREQSCRRIVRRTRSRERP